MAKKTNIPIDNNIIKVPIEEAMPDNYLPYAVEVAKERALPDVRDGLKPVQRRILYGAYKLKAFPDKPYYKSARIVGDILGKYHPHGDTSVYDAMVILAQDFTTRKTLIDGHGNWGSQDGDSAAAMRYTEARLTDIALEMLKDIEKDVVDMQENYSGSELEPEVLPSRFPNLIVNGAFGIAVGLATNIPPHNLSEVIDATLACIDNENISTKELMEYVKGPDFPTGGIIIGEDSLLSAYETGKGKAVLRAKTSIEKLKNDKYAIVITEFPYRKSKAKILQSISEMTGDKKNVKALDAIADIRDESDRNGIRGVIELKKSVDKKTAEKVLKYLFMKTELQCNINFNMVALAKGKPETMGLKTMLNHYIEHQKNVIKRRTEKELEIAEERFHIVEGFIKAISIMDDIIATIRASKSKKDAESNLMKLYKFTKIQSEAIVELMLYKLTGLEIETFQKEHEKLKKEIKKLKNILQDEKELFKVMKKELIEVKQKYGGDRLTKIINDENKADIDIEEVLISEDNVITMSNNGYIKRISQKSYSRSNTDVDNIDYREGDYNKFLFKSNTTDTIMFFTDKGNMYQIKCVKIPEMKWKEKGEKLDIIIKDLDLSNEKIINVFSISNIKDKMDFLIVTSTGSIKKTSLSKFYTNYTKILALKLRSKEKLVNIELIPIEREEKFIRVKTLNGLEFTVKEPKLENVDRNIIGTQLFELPKGDEIISVEYIDDYTLKNFTIIVNNNDIINLKDKITSKQKKLLNCSTSSLEKLLFFASNGNVYLIPAFMLENIGKPGIKFNKLLYNFNPSKDKILNILSTKKFKEDKSIYFFTEDGLVKRTHLSEFKGDYFEDTAYKFKNKNDSIVKVKINDNKFDSDIIIVTKKGMCIRFDSSSINYTGKMASGVFGIDLIKDDKVVYADLICKSINSNKDELAIDEDKAKSIKLISNKNNEKLIEIGKIKSQNRAGRGKNIMSVDLNDYIKKVEVE